MKKEKLVSALLVIVVITIASLVFASCAPTAPPATSPTAPAAPKPKAIKWIGQACLPAGMPVHEGLVEFAKRVTEASGGRLVLEAKPAGAVCPATKEWKAIDKGVLDFAACAGSYMVPDVPFGTVVCQRAGSRLPPMAVYAWYEIEGRDLINKWYEKFGYDFIEIGGLQGLPEGWIHLDKPLKGPEDLKGLKMRCAGDCGEILHRMGVGAVFMPLGEIFENMKRGVIDAFECSCPAFDWKMGLYEVGKYYYLNPTRAPWELYNILVKRSKWEKLPDDLKVILRDCAEAENIYYHSRLVKKNAEAIKKFKDYGVVVEKLPESIAEAFVKEAGKFYSEKMAKYPSVKEVLGSQLEFEKIWEELYGLPR